MQLLTGSRLQSSAWTWFWILPCIIFIYADFVISGAQTQTSTGTWPGTKPLTRTDNRPCSGTQTGTGPRTWSGTGTRHCTEPRTWTGTQTGTGIRTWTRNRTGIGTRTRTGTGSCSIGTPPMTSLVFDFCNQHHVFVKSLQGYFIFVYLTFFVKNTNIQTVQVDQWLLLIENKMNNEGQT